MPVQQARGIQALRWRNKTAAVNGVVYEPSGCQPPPIVVPCHPAGWLNPHSLCGTLKSFPGNDFPGSLAYLTKGDAIRHIIIDKQG